MLGQTMSTLEQCGKFHQRRQYATLFLLSRAKTICTDETSWFHEELTWGKITGVVGLEQPDLRLSITIDKPFVNPNVTGLPEALPAPPVRFDEHRPPLLS
jgi:hypothetical protein